MPSLQSSPRQGPPIPKTELKTLFKQSEDMKTNENSKAKPDEKVGHGMFRPGRYYKSKNQAQSQKTEDEK